MRFGPIATKNGVLTFVLGLAVIAGSVIAAGQARADKRDLIGSFRDWDAFTISRGTGEKICYMVSVPKKWTASRQGVRRGNIYITVTHRPKARVRNEVNVVAGYPYGRNGEATANIDGKRRFKMFTEGDGAWLRTPREDTQMVDAMKRGNNLVVVGTSARGTRTTDNYSLAGFTAAHNAINKACP